MRSRDPSVQLTNEVSLHARRTEMKSLNVSRLHLFSCLLRRCNHHQSTTRVGKQIHAQIISNALLPHATLHTDLILMYSRCASLSDARKVFDDMPNKNMHSWNILISAFVQESLCQDALTLFLMFMGIGLRPDHYTLPSALKACGVIGELFLGMTVHGIVVRLGLMEHVVVGGSVLNMYCKCGKTDDASRLFAEMPERDVVAWNSMISGLVSDGSSVLALDLYRRMSKEGIKMDQLMVVPSILNACGREGEVRLGKEIHGRLIRSSTLFDSLDVVVGNSLVDMYGKCGFLADSHNVFLKMPRRNLVTWTTLISCYGVHGMGEESLLLYDAMKSEGFEPNCVTFTALLSGCRHSGLVSEGRRAFLSMVSDYSINPQEEHYSCMVDLLGRNGDLDEALKLTMAMPMEPTASVWGALLGACVVHKNVEIGETAARMLFGLEPKNPSNYIAMLSIYDACGMWEDVSSMRSRMRGLGLVKTVGCSWISIKKRMHSFVQGDVAHRLSPEIYDMLHWLLRTMVFSDDDDYVGKITVVRQLCDRSR